MLYDRWRAVVRARRHELALREVASGRRWTFDQLAAAAERLPGSGAPVAFPRGHDAEFILALLAAWRAGQTACPLEPDQAVPDLPPPPDWCAHLKFTSATTGRARLVAVRATQLAADPAQIVATMGLRPEWPNLAAISMAHSYGFSSLVLPLLLHGIPLILAATPLPEGVRQAAAGERALTLPGVPALWRAWHEAGAIPAGVKLAISAGAPLPLALEQAVFGQTGLKVHNFYGASECGGIAYDRTERPRSDAALAGTPLANVALSVGEDGCLRVRGPNVGETYWPEAMPALSGGVFRAGDLAALRDGQVFLLGRAVDVVHVAGRKVAPETIEQALLAHPLVREALVLGLPAPDGEREDVVAAVVAAAPTVTEVELRDFLLARLPAWQAPRVWRFVDTLHTTRRGKVSRAAWRERLRQRH